MCGRVSKLFVRTRTDATLREDADGRTLTRPPKVANCAMRVVRVYSMIVHFQF